MPHDNTNKIILVCEFHEGMYYDKGENMTGPYSLPGTYGLDNNAFIVHIWLEELENLNSTKTKTLIEEIKCTINEKMHSRNLYGSKFDPKELKVIVAGHGAANDSEISNMVETNEDDKRFKSADLYTLGSLIARVVPTIKQTVPSIEKTNVKFLSCDSMTSDFTKQAQKADNKAGVKKVKTEKQISLIHPSQPETKVYIDSKMLENIQRKNADEDIGSAGYFLRGVREANPNVKFDKVTGVHGSAITRGARNYGHLTKASYSFRAKEGGAKIVFKPMDDAVVNDAVVTKPLEKKPEPNPFAGLKNSFIQEEGQVTLPPKPSFAEGMNASPSKPNADLKKIAEPNAKPAKHKDGKNKLPKIGRGYKAERGSCCKLQGKGS